MRSRLLVTSALAVLGVAACTSTTSGSPTTAPTTQRVTSISSTPPVSSPAPTSPSPTVPTTGPNVRPGEKPPVLAAVGKTHTNAGALTYAEFWFQTWDWAYATTDATLMKQYYAKSCTDCALAADQFAKVRAKGEHLKGGRLIFRKASLVLADRRHGADLAVDVTIGQRPLRVVTSANKVVGHSAFLSHSTFRLWLRWTRGSWIIVYKAHVT